MYHSRVDWPSSEVLVNAVVVVDVVVVVVVAAARSFESDVWFGSDQPWLGCVRVAGWH